MRLDGYIRVSRVGGRDGDSFISPDVQREQIEAYAKSRGYSIAGWFEDLDQSGGTFARPGFTAALERARSGATDGIIAAKLDRLSRSLSGLSGLIEEAKASSWTLVAVDFGLDVKSASGKLVADILGAIAEWERTRRTEDWSTAQARAVARGVHIASRVPTGYRRGEDGRLQPDPDAAPVIRELFARRAAGEGWTALASFLDSNGVVGPYSAAVWTPGAVRGIVLNRVYLGEARSGEFVNQDAHEPIVSRVEWEAAQIARPGSNVRKGDGLLLSGLIRCAGCRYLMKAERSIIRGKVYPLYACRKRHASGICPAPATILARLIDPHVEQAFLSALGPDGVLAEAAEFAVSADAVAALEDAERELAVYRDETLVSVLGVEAYRAGLETRARRVEDARRAFTETRGRESIDPQGVLAAWPELTVAERRSLLTAGLDAVVVRSSGRGKVVPAAERSIVLWRGEAPADLPRRGHRVPLRSWGESPDELGVAAA